MQSVEFAFFEKYKNTKKMQSVEFAFFEKYKNTKKMQSVEFVFFGKYKNTKIEDNCTSKIVLMIRVDLTNDNC